MNLTNFQRNIKYKIQLLARVSYLGQVVEIYWFKRTDYICPQITFNPYYSHLQNVIEDGSNLLFAKYTEYKVYIKWLRQIKLN